MVCPVRSVHPGWSQYFIPHLCGADLRLCPRSGPRLVSGALHGAERSPAGLGVWAAVSFLTAS